MIWKTLFRFLDADKSGRLTWKEFLAVCADDLKLFTGDQLVSLDEIKAVWLKVDTDHSMEVTRNEFTLGFYQMILAQCPILDAGRLRRVVKILDHAAARWHRASGN